MRKTNYHTNATSILFGVLAIAISTLTCAAQTPPPNDNLANATVLTGTDLTFSGSLAGSTVESNEVETTFGYTDPDFTNSVWWSWTAPTNTVLNLILAQPGLTGLVYLVVHPAQNGVTSPSGLTQPPIVSAPMGLGEAPLNWYVSVPVTAGSNYLIQLIGYGTGSSTFRLVATNTPVIAKQPVSQTVDSNGCGLFYVVTTGVYSQPRSYQWYFNGTAISGETAPIYAPTNVDASMAGSYTVLVSNATGVVLSAPATLAISPSNVPPVLTAQGRSSNSLTFRLDGEIGRPYVIENSTNLHTWNPENSFSSYYGHPWLANIVHPVDASSLVLSITNASSSAFYRATIYRPKDAHAVICDNHLQQICIAKILWQLDTNPGITTYPLISDLTPYLPHVESLYCPDDTNENYLTSYTGNYLQNAPECKINVNHTLDWAP